MLTGSAPNKMTSFRSAVRQFRNAESGPKDLIDTVFNVLDRDADATTGVVREVASLVDNDGEREKQQALLAAVNSFRIEVRQLFLYRLSFPLCVRDGERPQSKLTTRSNVSNSLHCLERRQASGPTTRESRRAPFSTPSARRRPTEAAELRSCGIESKLLRRPTLSIVRPG
jgi:hypothetical protein